MYNMGTQQPKLQPKPLKVMTPQKSKTTTAQGAEMVKPHDIFQVVKTNGKYVICFGNTRISQKDFKNEDEATKYIDSKPYELIINTCCYVWDSIKEQTKKF